MNPDAHTILTALLIGMSSWTLRELVSLGKKVAGLEQQVRDLIARPR